MIRLDWYKENISNQTRCETRKRVKPIVINAGLEHAMRKWKLRVQHCGPHCGDDELLTNVRYADDLMLYARSDTDLATMVECLVEELAAVGVNLSTSKTKIWTTENLNEPMVNGQWSMPVRHKASPFWAQAVKRNMYIGFACNFKFLSHLAKRVEIFKKWIPVMMVLRFF